MTFLERGKGVDCQKCGVHNPEGVERCKICGTPLSVPKAPSGPTRECPFCGTENDKEAPFCSTCNKPLYSLEGKAEKTEKAKREKYYDRTYVDYPGSAARTARAGLGGILIMMAALFALIDALFTLLISWEMSQLADYNQLVAENPQLEGVLSSLVVCEGLRIVFIIIAIMGAVFAVRRSRWGLAMIGGIFSILSVGSSFLMLVIPLWIFIVLALGIGAIIGVILVGVSRREFLLG